MHQNIARIRERTCNVAWLGILMITAANTACDRVCPAQAKQVSAQSSRPTLGPIASADEAAAVAAGLANEECRRLYRKEPFSPERYTPRLVNGEWQWGRYDPAGPGGFSAEVALPKDGGVPSVRINYSTDAEPDD